MRTNFIFTITFLFLSTVIVYSSVSLEWEARYHPSANSIDYSNDMVSDHSENIYVVGRTFGYNSENFNWAIAKFNSNGIMIWDRVYNGQFPTGFDDAISVSISNSLGYIYVTGYEQAPNASNMVIVTKKISLDGNLLWSKTFASNYDKPYKIVLSSAGNIFVAGYSGNSALLIKYNQNGDSLWVKKYNNNNQPTNQFIDIEIDLQENIYAACNSMSNIILVKYNTNGNVIWEKSYNGPGNSTDNVYALCTDNTGNFYVAGESIGTDNTFDYVSLAYDHSGNFRWASRIASTPGGDETAIDIVCDNDGFIYTTGFIDAGTEGSNYLTVKNNAAGNILWQKQFNNQFNKWDIAEKIVVGSQNEVYITGRSGRPPSPFDPDYCTIRYDSSGAQIWVMSYNGNPSVNGSDIPSKLIIGDNSNLYVCGTSNGNSSYDICVLKYSQVIGLQQISGNIPTKFSISQNYPNPFNPVTKIRFSLPKQSFVKLTIYDISGKVMSILSKEYLQAGRYETNFDASHLSSGIYFYTLSTPDFIETKKMVLIK